ncbi:MAG: aldo/keto reductase, partial [Actinomycetota bacterium]|nr:aldo/keto reductase [Actinomycetota bacterium]
RSPHSRGDLPVGHIGRRVVVRATANNARSGGTCPAMSAAAAADAVGAVADGRGVPRAQAALIWLMSRPAVSALIVGASKPAHLADAVAAVDLHLTDDKVAALQDPYVPHPVVGHT